MSGLIGPQAFSNAVTPYYALAGSGTSSLISPVNVVSADGTKTGVIDQNNNGNMIIYSDTAGALFLGNNSGAVAIKSTDGDYGNSLLSAGNQLQLIGASQATLKSNSSGFFLGMSSDAFINKGGANGIVYDSVYNKPFTFTTLQAQTTGNIAYNQTLTPSAGKYQLQLTVENPVAPAGSSLEMFAVDLPGTQVINFSGAEVLSSSVGTNLLTLNSGYFTYDGVDGLKVEIIVTGSAWSGTWEFQLVKLG